MGCRRAGSPTWCFVTPLVVDAGALLASINARDPAHAAVRAVLETAAGPVVTSQLVLAEADYMVLTRGGIDLELAFLGDVLTGALRAEGLTPDELTRAVDVVARYRDLEIGMADASLVVLCARHRTRSLLTLGERCFRAMAPLQGGAFTLLPADG